MAKITVYTKNGCPQCEMTKNVLKGEGIEFKVVNVEEINPETQELTEEAQKGYDFIVNELGLRQMPVVVVEGQEPFTGFRPDKLHELKK
jgi:glutaredoxin-like protein NrdH